LKHSQVNVPASLTEHEPSYPEKCMSRHTGWRSYFCITC